MSRSKNILIAATLMLAMVLAVGCQPKAKGLSPREKKGFERLAVMPFIVAQPDNPDKPEATCAITGGCFNASDVPAEAPRILDRLLEKNLNKYCELPFVSADQTGLVAREALGRDVWLADRQDIADIGRRLKVDAVLVGAVYRWQERVGGPLAAERPAAVTFELALVTSADGSLLWTGNFDQAQQPLTDNWLNIEEYAQHGVQWFSVAQFADIGMDTLMKGFPFRKKKGK